GLSRGGEVHPAQQLVDDLEALPVPGGLTDDGRVRGEGVQQRAHRGDVLLRTAHHDEQIALGGARGAAGDGGVDDPGGGAREARGGLLDRRGADGGHDQHGRRLGEHLGDPVLAPEDGLELRRRRDHDHHDVRAARRRAGGGGGSGHVREGVAGGGVEVEGGDGEAGRGGGAGHRRADGAQTDPGDGGGGGHGVLLGAGRGGAGWGRAGQGRAGQDRAGRNAQTRVARDGGRSRPAAQRAATAAVRVSTTSARACSPPTLPGKTTYGMPSTSAGASWAENRETCPSQNWPSTRARRMPSPFAATSWEVMPPLATTQAGRAVRTCWTTSTTASETRRAIARDSA